MLQAAELLSDFDNDAMKMNRKNLKLGASEGSNTSHRPSSTALQKYFVKRSVITNKGSVQHRTGLLHTSASD